MDSLLDWSKVTALLEEMKAKFMAAGGTEEEWRELFSRKDAGHDRCYGLDPKAAQQKVHE